MSAEIYDNDWLFSGNGQRPWHGIGTIVSGTPTSDEAIRLARLDWDVLQYPVVANDKTIEGYFANVRSDTNEALGIVRGRYKIVQNLEAFDFVDDIIGEGTTEVHYETAGSLFNGRRVFLLCRLPNQKVLGDDIENYLFFTNSHDGTSSLMAGMTNIRVVCNNTLQLAIRSARRMWKCRHTESIQDRKKQAQISLGLSLNYIGEMKQTAESMARKIINEKQFFETLFAQSEMVEKNKEQLILNIHDIYHKKDDLTNFRGTAWGMYNAVADFVSNGEPMRKTKNYEQQKLANFFDGYKLLNTAQQILSA